MTSRGEIWWADPGSANGSTAAKRRPVLVIQAEAFNRSRLSTVIVAAITSNTQLAELPGNVFVPSEASGLPRDSAVNVTQLVTVDQQILTDAVGMLPDYLLDEVNAGLRRVLGI